MKKSNNGAGGVLLTGPQLAHALGQKERTILSWRHAGIIPYLQLGHRTVRFRLDDVNAALARREIKAVV